MVVQASAAPGELKLVRAFVNTLDVESGEDGLDSPRSLAGWLVDGGLLPAGSDATRGDLRAARALREALRALLAANNGGPSDGAAAGVVEGAARRARLALRFTPDGSAVLEPAAPGVPGALGRLVAIVAAAMTAGTWSRLKVCRADGCRWAFYDGARNRSRAWCSMAVCGNRAKASAYRRRSAER